jgi:hypothetical protein
LWRELQNQPAAAAILAQALANNPTVEVAQWEKVTRQPWPLARAENLPLGNPPAAQ